MLAERIGNSRQPMPNGLASCCRSCCARAHTKLNCWPGKALQRWAETGDSGELDEHLAQLALDTAEWLKTLWNVGYMGAGNFRSTHVRLSRRLTSKISGNLRSLPAFARASTPFRFRRRPGRACPGTNSSKAGGANPPGQRRDHSRRTGSADRRDHRRPVPSGRLSRKTPRIRSIIVQHQGKGPRLPAAAGRTPGCRLHRESPS
jgi:hypothetical protein